MAQNSIGTFEFIALLGELEKPQQTLEIDQRAGTLGTTVTWTGRKGKPFQLISQVDAVDYIGARTLYDLYTELKDSEPVDVVQGGVPSGASNFLCQVLDVQPLRIGVLAAAVGQAINPPSRGYIECLWTLIAIET